MTTSEKKSEGANKNSVNLLAYFGARTFHINGGHHTLHEWISRKSFLQFVPIMRAFLESSVRLQ